jgi:hypothetical protein
MAHLVSMEPQEHLAEMDSMDHPELLDLKDNLAPQDKLLLQAALAPPVHREHLEEMELLAILVALERLAQLDLLVNEYYNV